MLSRMICNVYPEILSKEFTQIDGVKRPVSFQIAEFHFAEFQFAEFQIAESRISRNYRNPIRRIPFHGITE